MEVFGLVRVFVNKTVVSNGPGRQGIPGYPRLQSIRLLVYAKLGSVETDKGLIRHLNKKRHVASYERGKNR